MMRQDPIVKRFPLLGSVSIVIYGLCALLNAWIVDDAYITLRTVYNFLHGYGLRWNISERVQTYTHPLWMFILALFTGATNEFFFTPIFLSFAVSSALLAVYWRYIAARSWARLTVVIWLFIASKAYTDYSSSGLENPLAVLIGLWFLFEYRRTDSLSSSQWDSRTMRLGAITACAWLTREDNIVLFIPALLDCLWFQYKQKHTVKAFVALALGLLPCFLWLAFCMVYYGFPHPNTAYAKLLSTGVSQASRIRHGWAYIINSFVWDPVTVSTIILSVIWSFRKGPRWQRNINAGVVVYLIYVIVAGASGTHMSGRFLSVPFAIAVASWTACAPSVALRPLSVYAISASFIWNPGSAILHRGCGWAPLSPGGVWSSGLIDTRYFVCTEGAALARLNRNVAPPNHPWYQAGLELKRSNVSVVVGGPSSGKYAMGYFGFAAGPHKHIVDPAGLTDPLLSRLPAKDTKTWVPGHFIREIPEGYVESIETHTNQIRSPKIARLYERIRLITAGPIWSVERFQEIWSLWFP